MNNLLMALSWLDGSSVLHVNWDEECAREINGDEISCECGNVLC